jgi:hypothetical protein
MSWQKDFPNLAKRIKDKTKWADRTLSNNVQKVATRHSIATDAALFVIAKESGVGYLGDLKKLSNEDRVAFSAVKPATSQSVGRKSGSQKSKPASRVVSLKTDLGTFSDPYLSPSIIDQAKLMSETVYPYLFVFENSIRNFINLVMTKEAGPNWWDTEMSSGALKDVANEANKRIEKEKDDYYHGARAAHPLFYTDFTHLIQIIKSKETIFQKYLKNMTGMTSTFLAKLQEIQPSRNVSSHHNPLGKHDVNRIYQYLIDWTAQLKYLKDKGIL